MLDWTFAAQPTGLWSPDLWADGIWTLAIAAMVLMSVRVWRRIDSEAWAPLQWGRDGRPVMRAQRDLAVAFTPMVALAGGLLLAAGARLGDAAETGWTVLRLTAPLVLVVLHQVHLKGAIKTLKAEGGLRA